MRISEIVSDSPKEALLCLDSIDCQRLSDTDRHFYDFLAIKARDKAYITHTSDSLILDLLSFYRGSDLYPEILYYAGRTYSDLGDFPSALKYFQNGLDHIKDNGPEALNVKGNILSQTAGVLSKLRLYTRAIPYMEDVLRIDSIEGDTFNLAYDYHSLGAIYLHQNKLDDADKCFITATEYARHLTERDKIQMQTYRAAIKLEKGEIDSALILIRGIPEQALPIQQNLVYINASNIYLAAGIIDSAYYYADKLIHNNDTNNRKNGYRNLFSEELYNLIPDDSIPAYIRKYFTALESYYDSHESQEALMQNAFYNYQIHQRERTREEERNRRFTYIIAALILIVLISVIAILFLRNKKKTLLLSLHSSILELDNLRKSLSARDSPRENPISTTAGQGATTNLESLKESLYEQIRLLKEESANRTPVQADILDSEILRKINRYISDNKTIPDNNRIWTELEEAILSASPLFKERLHLLVGENLKPHDYHVVLLIRCGITPSQMTILLGRTKGTISYRRKHVCEILLGEKIDSQFIDDIIRYI